MTRDEKASSVLLPTAEGCDAASRVLLVAPQPFYEDRGTPIAVSHTLKALSQLGYQVDVLTFPAGRDLDIPGVRYFRVANPLRIRHVPIGFSFRKLWLDLFLFIALLRRLRAEQYLCVHAVEEAAFLAVIAAGPHRIPVMYDMQSSMAEQMAERPWLRNRLIKVLLFACERWLIRHVASTVCSAGLTRRVRAESPGARIREWRYPSLIPSVALMDVDRLKTELRIALQRPIVVYTGNFEEYQGLPALIAAIPLVLARVPRAVFVFVGADGASGTDVKRLLATLPSEAYRLVRRQPCEMMPRFLAMATVAVSPRVIGSNLPLKVLEYLAAGRAIVATAIPAHRTLLSEELAVIAEPTSEALASAIAGLLENPDRAARLEAAARRYAETHLHWIGFAHLVGELYAELQERGAMSHRNSTEPAAQPANSAPPSHALNRAVSVIIPARNAAPMIAQTVRAVFAQRPSHVNLEVLVVDDGSTDHTASLVRAAGARVIPMSGPVNGGNPAAARNRGVTEATGDVLVFLDADCTPAKGWLAALLARHAEGAICVGGSLALPRGLSASARWDYYCGWYHAHPRRAPGFVANHPPCNLSIRRAAFSQTCGFTERQPIAYAHEELAWQAQLQRAGVKIYFEPRAVVCHWNRPGFGNLLRRNYRWAYSAIESKAESGAARVAWLYRHPRLLIATSILRVPLETIYIVACWLRAGRLEPLLALPAVFAARLAYATGMTVGGLRWLRRRGTTRASSCPRWI